MASHPLRVLSLAYFDMSLEDWESQFEGQDSSPDKILEEALSTDQLPLNFVASFGLKDELRPMVRECVRYAHELAQIRVRLVSGDHIETAKA